MPTLVLKDGTTVDTEGVYVIPYDIDKFKGYGPLDFIDFADEYGEPIENVLHRQGYTV